MGSIQAWPVHERWVQYQAGRSIYNGIITHNPNLGLRITAGQLVKNGFHTEECKMTNSVVNTLHGHLYCPEKFENFLYQPLVPLYLQATPSELHCSKLKSSAQQILQIVTKV